VFKRTILLNKFEVKLSVFIIIIMKKSLEDDIDYKKFQSRKRKRERDAESARIEEIMFKSKNWRDLKNRQHKNEYLYIPYDVDKKITEHKHTDHGTPPITYAPTKKIEVENNLDVYSYVYLGLDSLKNNNYFVEHIYKDEPYHSKGRFLVKDLAKSMPM